MSCRSARQALAGERSRGREQNRGGWQLNEIVTLLSVSIHSGDRHEPVGDGDTAIPTGRRESFLFGTVVLGKWPMVQSERIRPARRRYVRQFGARRVHRSGLADMDVSLFKNTALSERTSLQFRAEFFNVLNHPNLGSPNATVFSSGAINASAGLITTLATTPRQIQFGMKLIF